MPYFPDRVCLYKLLCRMSALYLGGLVAEMSGGFEQGKRKMTTRECGRETKNKDIKL